MSFFPEYVQHLLRCHPTALILLGFLDVRLERCISAFQPCSLRPWLHLIGVSLYNPTPAHMSIHMP
jgi:hypothetical protein